MITVTFRTMDLSNPLYGERGLTQLPAKPRARACAPGRLIDGKLMRICPKCNSPPQPIIAQQPQSKVSSRNLKGIPPNNRGLVAPGCLVFIILTSLGSFSGVHVHGSTVVVPFMPGEAVEDALNGGERRRKARKSC